MGIMGWDREIEMSDQEEKEATENCLLSGIQAQNTEYPS